MNTTGAYVLVMIIFNGIQNDSPVFKNIVIYEDPQWAFYQCKVDKDNFERGFQKLGIPFVYMTCTQEKAS